MQCLLCAVHTTHRIHVHHSIRSISFHQAQPINTTRLTLPCPAPNTQKQKSSVFRLIALPHSHSLTHSLTLAPTLAPTLTPTLALTLVLAIAPKKLNCAFSVDDQVDAVFYNGVDVMKQV